MKLRLAAPETLVDMGGLRELPYVRDEGDTIAIGARVKRACGGSAARNTLADSGAPLS